MFTTFISNLEGAQNKIVEFALSHSKKISAISTATKALTFAVFFAVVPIGTVSGKDIVYTTHLKLDTKNAFTVSSSSKKTEIALGESSFDTQEREKAIAQAKAEAAVQVASAESVSHDDPSDFRPIYQDAGARYGIPWQLIEAVHQVESGKSGSTSECSSAGACGPFQFMPGTWRTYGVDGNGDGVADASNVVDAIYGAANLLASSGAADGNINSALLNYNHAQWYVDKVLDVAYSIGMPQVN